MAQGCRGGEHREGSSRGRRTQVEKVHLEDGEERRAKE